MNPWLTVEFEGVYFPCNLGGLLDPLSIHFERLDILSLPIYVITSKENYDKAVELVKIGQTNQRNEKEKKKYHLPTWRKWKVDYLQHCSIIEEENNDLLCLKP